MFDQWQSALTHAKKSPIRLSQLAVTWQVILLAGDPDTITFGCVGQVHLDFGKVAFNSRWRFQTGDVKSRYDCISFGSIPYMFICFCATAIYVSDRHQTYTRQISDRLAVNCPLYFCKLNSLLFYYDQASCFIWGHLTTQRVHVISRTSHFSFLYSITTKQLQYSEDFGTFIYRRRK